MVNPHGSNRDQQTTTDASDYARATAARELGLRRAKTSQWQPPEEELRSLVASHLKSQQHAQVTVDLIDQIITRFPGCPRAQSYWVDRLLAGDEALADALREQEGI